MNYCKVISKCKLYGIDASDTGNISRDPIKSVAKSTNFSLCNSDVGLSNISVQGDNEMKL